MITHEFVLYFKLFIQYLSSSSISSTVPLFFTTLSPPPTSCLPLPSCMKHLTLVLTLRVQCLHCANGIHSGLKIKTNKKRVGRRITRTKNEEEEKNKLVHRIFFPVVKSETEYSMCSLVNFFALSSFSCTFSKKCSKIEWFE